MKGKGTLTTLDHPYFVTLAKSAGLAAFTAVLVYGALVCGRTDVIIVSYSRKQGDEWDIWVDNTDNIMRQKDKGW